MHAPNKQAGRAMSAAQNKMHINDWAAIQTLFDKLNKQVGRTRAGPTRGADAGSMRARAWRAALLVCRSRSR